MSLVNVLDVASKKRKAKKAKDDDDRKSKRHLEQLVVRIMEKRTGQLILWYWQSHPEILGISYLSYRIGNSKRRPDWWIFVVSGRLTRGE